MVLTYLHAMLAATYAAIVVYELFH